jgi:hypothetical protein
MPRIRVRIGAICGAIALLAIDIVIWKSDLSAFGVWVIMGVRGTLVATTVLAFTVPYALTRRGSRPFAAGLLATGFPGVLVYWTCCWLAPWQVYVFLQKPVDELVIGRVYFDGIPGLEQALLAGSRSARLFFDMTCFPLIVTIDSLPLLCIAVLGGWAARAHALRPPRLGAAGSVFRNRAVRRGSADRKRILGDRHQCRRLGPDPACLWEASITVGADRSDRCVMRPFMNLARMQLAIRSGAIVVAVTAQLLVMRSFWMLLLVLLALPLVAQRDDRAPRESRSLLATRDLPHYTFGVVRHCTVILAPSQRGARARCGAICGGSIRGAAHVREHSQS